MAAENGQREVLHKLWEWAKQVKAHDELNNIFLAKDIQVRATWHFAAKKDQIYIHIYITQNECVGYRGTTTRRVKYFEPQMMVK